MHEVHIITASSMAVLITLMPVLTFIVGAILL